MHNSPLEFRLAEWRRPIAWANTLQLCLLIAPVFGLIFAFIITKTLRLELPWNLALGMALAALGTGAVLYGDHRRMPTGSLRLEPGRLEFTGWGTRRWDVPIDRVTILDQSDDVLVIRLRGAPPIRLHQARLALPLSAVRAAVVQHLALPPADPARRAELRASAAVYAARLRQSVPTLLVLLAILLLAWWSSRL